MTVPKLLLHGRTTVKSCNLIGTSLYKTLVKLHVLQVIRPSPSACEPDPYTPQCLVLSGFTRGERAGLAHCL